MARTRQSGVVRKEQIKKAVKLIIDEKGFKGLSTHHLAEKLGLSEGAIYRHFESKAQIISDIVGDVRKDMIGALQKVAMGSQPPKRRLKKFMCTHIRYLIENKGITILLFTEATYQQDDATKKELHEIFKLLKYYFSKIVTDGISEGIWDDTLSVENLATLYLGIPLTMNIELNIHSGEAYQLNFCEQMFTLILKILEKGVQTRNQ